MAEPNWTEEAPGISVWPAQTAHEFLTALRRSNNYWWEDDQIPWVFRGHKDKSWPLLPAAWRPGNRIIANAQTEAARRLERINPAQRLHWSFGNHVTGQTSHVEDFPVLHMRSLRKTAMFSEGQRTEGHFRCPGASKPITIIVDLRSEHNLEVLLEVGHTDSATNMQVIGLTHRPTGFNGRRWYFVSTNGERAETLFLVEGFVRTRTQ